MRLKVVVPRHTSAEERHLFEELRRVSQFNPRAEGRAAKGAA